jgi:cephalosporin hydroxylase
MPTIRGAYGEFKQRIRPFWYGTVVRPRALTGLIWRTGNCSDVTGLGHPIWQNPLDAWMIQEAIVQDEIDLVIECGTNRGGSAYFLGTLFDLLGRGRVITVDIEDIAEVRHPRVDYVLGSSVESSTVDRVAEEFDRVNPSHPMVLLDSDHAGPHVLKEMQLYSRFIPVGGYMAVQDGCIDELRIMRSDRPGPLWAINAFLAANPNFEVDHDRSTRFVYSHSPKGWVRRIG